MTKVRDADFTALTSALADVQAHLPGVDWLPANAIALLEGTVSRGGEMLWVVGHWRRSLEHATPKWHFAVRARRLGDVLGATCVDQDAAVAARDALNSYREVIEHTLRLVEGALQGGEE